MKRSELNVSSAVVEPLRSSGDQPRSHVRLMNASM